MSDGIKSLLSLVVYFIFALGVASFGTIAIVSVEIWWEERKKKKNGGCKSEH